MGFNFPNSPTEGAVYTAPTGQQYTFTNGVWLQTGFAYTPLLTAQPYNRVVNGAMLISQENGNTASAPSLGNNYYPADQWTAVWNLATGTAQSVRNLAPALNNDPYIQIATSPGATLTTAHYAALRAPIEGVRVADLNWGTANARQIIVRALLHSAGGGTFTLRIGNAPLPPTRSYLKEFTLAPATWTEIVAIIPGDTTGTWTSTPGDTALGMIVDFTAGAGSTYKASGVGWQAGNFYAGPNQTNFLATASGALNLARVGLYLDPNNTGVAPPWQMPDYAQELAACQRYWCTQHLSMGGSAVGNMNVGFALPATMRVLPAAALLAAGSVSGMTNLSLQMSSVKAGYFTGTVSAANQYAISYAYAFTARM